MEIKGGVFFLGIFLQFPFFGFLFLLIIPKERKEVLKIVALGFSLSSYLIYGAIYLKLCGLQLPAFAFAVKLFQGG